MKGEQWGSKVRLSRHTKHLRLYIPVNSKILRTRDQNSLQKGFPPHSSILGLLISKVVYSPASKIINSNEHNILFFERSWIFTLV